MTTRIELNHLARVEGHGGVTVELDGDQVRTARLEIFEGARLIEGLVRGRRWDEVAPLVSRICAICSSAHTLASLAATERAFGVSPSPETLLLRDLLLRGESIESHALHVFLLAVPDYLNAPSAIALAAERRDVVALGLRLKRLGNAIQEIVGGRAIHPVNAVPGGFGSRPSMDKLVRLRAALAQGVADVQTTLDFVAALPPQDAGRSDSAYAATWLPAGYGYEAADQIAIELRGQRELVPAAAYRTILAERTVAHSHAKHSRWDGTPITVGALARLAVNGGRLPPSGVAAAARLGLVPPFEDPLANNAAQVVELVVDVERALELVDRLLHAPAAPAPPVPIVPREGQGTAALEAPRGLLIHSYTYDRQGRLQQADIITPTAINAASIEHRLRKAVEQSPARDEASLTHRLEMVVRAYDPCLSCSVH
jgi:coenzyme F420-reducing hydrogenase alpha subunit